MPFHFDFGIVKRHPYLFAGGGIALFVIIYYVISSSSSDQAGASTGSTTSTEDDQLAAAENIAGLQAQTQLQGAQIAADVQSQSISASQEVTDNQTSASLQAYLANSNNSLAAVQSTNQTQVGLAQVQANEQDTVVNSLASIVGDQYSAQENQQNDVAGYLNNLTNTQGAVALQGLNNQAVATGDQYALDNNIVSATAPGLNYQISKGNNASQTSAEGVVESLTGDYPAAVSSVGGATQTELGNQSTTTSTAGVINSLSGAGSSVLAGLLA